MLLLSPVAGWPTIQSLPFRVIASVHRSRKKSSKQRQLNQLKLLFIDR
jgi:hypothetical protein